MARPSWEDLPGAVRQTIEQQVGLVLKAESATAGIMPGLAARVHLEAGHSVFVKAIPSTSAGSALHLTEAWAGRVLPEEAPAPRMLWNDVCDDWLVMVHEYVNDNSRHADLTPGSPDLPAVIGTVSRMEALLTPAPKGGADVARNVEALVAKGRHLFAKPAGVLQDRDVYERAVAGFDIADLAGDTLLHYDLSSTNILITGSGGVRVIDWAFACRGAAWVEAAMLAPRLVEVGHAPDAVEAMLSPVPSWAQAPRDALVGLTALWTMFRLYKALYGPENVREGRARAAVAGKAWLDHLAA
ncbi:phosphotransferase [Nonomuraea wenchangensis]|uniref:phosphotransferase n=1 Tax=Nonomuraea wenchangensis TaxID=568860 RepID=UPI003329EC41